MSQRNQPPLLLAAKGGHVAVIEVLLRRGAAFHDDDEVRRPTATKCQLQRNMIDIAMLYDRIDAVRLLVQAGASADENNKVSGKVACHVAAARLGAGLGKAIQKA